MILKRLANRFKNIYDSKYQAVSNIKSTPEQDGILENAKKFAKDNAIQGLSIEMLSTVLSKYYGDQMAGKIDQSKDEGDSLSQNITNE